MDLLLLRHAEAEIGRDDAARALTARGVKQAARMAAWLDTRLPAGTRVLVSPAVRAQQTAQPLRRDYETLTEIAPGASAAAILAAAGWPSARGTVLLVGHQPALGAAAALALTGKPAHWPLANAQVWWLSVRDGDAAPAVVAVMSPDVL